MLRRFYAVREQLWLQDGADPYLGRRLRGLLSDSGSGDVVATTTAISYGSTELVESFGRGRAEDCADEWYVSSAIGAGLATRADLRAMHDAWIEWAESPFGVRVVLVVPGARLEAVSPEPATTSHGSPGIAVSTGFPSTYTVAARQKEIRSRTGAASWSGSG